MTVGCLKILFSVLSVTFSIDKEAALATCCFSPMRRYYVLEELRVRRFADVHEEIIMF